MALKIIFLFKWYINIFLLLAFVSGTLSPKAVKGRKSESLALNSGPQDYTAFSKNLVVSKVSSRDIIENHATFFKETDNYNFVGMVLGYVTPWNNHGYDIAKIFGNKFTHISPVWLQVKKLKTNGYEITGIHDIDKKWMIHVKNAGRQRRLKIVPRILFEGWTISDFITLLNNQDEMDSLLKTIVSCVEQWHFDGLVFEFWTQLVKVVNNDLLINFVKKIGDTLLLHDLGFILVIPPDRGNEFFTKDHFAKVYDYVTAFSLMTYDFSSPDNPGPNAPIKWVEDCIKKLTRDKEQRKKILTGLNFYGNSYSSESRTIISSEYLKILSSFNGKLQYDSISAEHYFVYEDSYGKHIVYYPSLYSLSKRINLTEKLGTGLSIWELGQGLDYFYDLL